MKTVIANWKMNLGIRESVAQARGVLRGIQGKEVLPRLVVCPSFTALAEVRKVLVRTHVELGAQNVGPQRVGAFTGEVGAAQLEDVGCKYVMIGHSERRTTMHEDGAMVHEKVKIALESSLTPILCVGEDALAQIARDLKGIEVPRKGQLIVAYEPSWAIGTTNAAAPADVVEMHKALRSAVEQMTGISGDRLSVVYGGSVDAKNAYNFLREPEIDGVLVGGASLKIHEFEAIVNAAADVMIAQSV